MKNQLSKSKGIAIITTLLFSFMFLSFEEKDDYFEISKNLEIFNSVYQELNLYYVDETKPGELMTNGIKSMLKSLDPYTIYYPESRIEEARYSRTGKYGGIGIETLIEDGAYYVSEIFEGFPGEKAGMIPGDKIISIDGNETDGLNNDEMGTLIKGQAGSTIEVLVERMNETEPVTLTVERTEIEIPPVPYYGMINDEVGYVKLTSFTKTAAMDVRRAMKDLTSKDNMSKMILDLRGNGGGLLREAVNIVNLFVPKNTIIVKSKGKEESWNKTYEGLAEPLAPEMPLIVLVNEGSASASEVVSGALQDLDRAVVIGVQSFGKGLVQQTKDIAYNSKLKLTVAKYYTPTGRCIQKLDYSNKVGGKALEIDKARINQFTTPNGRIVTDGEGITPDVDIFEEEAGYLLDGLNSNNTLFHFATDYYYRNDSLRNGFEFRLNDKDYNDFISFAKNRGLDYSSDTEIQFEKLKLAVSSERLDAALKSELQALEDKIKPNLDSDLNQHKSLIKARLEGEIVSRYYFKNGQVKNELDVDPNILKSLEVFEGEYDAILAGSK